MKRRGQIVKRGERVWLVRVPLGNGPNGKRKYLNKTVYGTKADAERFLTSSLGDRDNGRLLEPSRQTLGEFANRWVTDARPGIQERTRESYRWVMEHYLVPTLGGRRLDQLNPSEIQRLYASLQERLSGRTVRYAHSILHAMLETACKWGMIASNPASKVEPPRQTRREMRALGESEAQRFIEAAKEDRFYALWILLVSTGLRPGEALGLKWADVDWDNARLRIQRVLVRLKAGAWHFAEPKTERSRRVVSLPQGLISILKTHRARQLHERLKAGADYTELDLVFGARSGQPLDYRLLRRRHFTRVLAKAGIKGIRVYDLRHTCATLLLAAGEHPKVVSERLGHSSIVMTLDVYSHVLPDMQQRAAESLEKMLFTSAEADEKKA